MAEDRCWGCGASSQEGNECICHLLPFSEYKENLQKEVKIRNAKMTENQKCKDCQKIEKRMFCKDCRDKAIDYNKQEGIRIGRKEALEKVLHEFEILQPKTKVEPVDLIVIPENDFWDFKEKLKSILKGKKKNV